LSDGVDDDVTDLPSSKWGIVKFQGAYSTAGDIHYSPAGRSLEDAD